MPAIASPNIALLRKNQKQVRATLKEISLNEL